MNDTEKKSLNFTMVGQRHDGPTVEDLTALYTHLTGKTATPEEIERCRIKLEQARAAHARPTESPARKP